MHRLCINSSRPGREAEARRGGGADYYKGTALLAAPLQSEHMCPRRPAAATAGRSGDPWPGGLWGPKEAA